MDAGGKKLRDGDMADLKNDAMEVERASNLVQHDIEKTKHLIEDNESKIRQALQEIEELQVKVALHKARSKSLGEDNRVSAELSRRIEARAQKWKKTSTGREEKTYFARDVIKNAAGANTVESDLEPACNRKVRLACKQILYLKKTQLDRDALERSRLDADDDVSRDHLWTMLEELLSDYQAKEILDSLCENTVQSSKSLVSKTKQVDLAKDADELRFKFESGKLKDISEQPILLRSVDQLIEQGQSAHFQRFLEAEKARNDAWRGRKRFEKAQQLINNILQKKYGSAHKEINLRRRALNLEMELYGISVAITYAKELMADLDDQRAMKKKEEDSLSTKFKKIQDFEARAQRNQLMIQALVKQNGTSRSRIEQQQKEVLSYLKNHVCAVGNEVDTMVNSIKQNLADELDQFSSLRISSLNTVELQSSRGLQAPYEEMSIHKLANLHDDKAGNLLKKILNELSFPSYLAPEELFVKIKEYKAKALETISNAEFLVDCKKGFEPTDLLEDAAKIEENCDEMTENAEKKKKETLPVINRALAIATDSLKECLELEELITSWWEQPAQFLVPWVKEDGMNLQEWRTQWDVHAARMAQIQF